MKRYSDEEVLMAIGTALLMLLDALPMISDSPRCPVCRNVLPRSTGYSAPYAGHVKGCPYFAAVANLHENLEGNRQQIDAARTIDPD